MATMEEIIATLNATENLDDLPGIVSTLQQVWGDYETGSAAALTQLRGEYETANAEQVRLQAELYKMSVALGENANPPKDAEPEAPAEADKITADEIRQFRIGRLM